MKKFIILMAALLFGAATIFSQTYVVSVDWYENECNCLDQGNSYYQVKVVIYDDANEMYVVTGTAVQVDFGTTEVEVSVPEVNTHCNRQLEYTPSLEVWAGVSVFCDSYTPPEGIGTSGGILQSDRTCTDFANDNVTFSNVTIVCD